MQMWKISFCFAPHSFNTRHVPISNGTKCCRRKRTNATVVVMVIELWLFEEGGNHREIERWRQVGACGNNNGNNRQDSRKGVFFCAVKIYRPTINEALTDPRKRHFFFYWVCMLHFLIYQPRVQRKRITAKRKSLFVFIIHHQFFKICRLIR